MSFVGYMSCWNSMTANDRVLLQAGYFITSSPEQLMI